MSQLKIKNGNNWESIPAGGVGVPSGGTAGQYLKKSSSVDYATEWTDFEVGDTSWDSSLGNGIQFRKTRGVVYVRCYLSNASIGSSAYTTIGTLPSGYAPDTSIYIVSGTNASGGIGTAYINSSGGIGVKAYSGTGSNFYFQTCYPV